MYNFGTIVLVPFPFTDLSSQKVRPALIISSDEFTSKSTDVILAFITSRQAIEKSPTHFELKSTDTSFETTGLKVDSIVRFNKLATLNKKLLLGELGKITESQAEKMRTHFHAAFGF